MKKGSDKGAWIIGGTTLIGTGVGLIFLKTSALLFVESVFITATGEVMGEEPVMSEPAEVIEVVGLA